jgi:3-phenylpropionate/trans-cinnamate dioxygenase ferredoxin reductase subunit
MKGPFGAAHFRPKEPRRLVLVSGGTGFAPIWAIAEAAIREKPMRELVLIAGVRELASLYMIPALCRLALFPYVTIIATVLTQQSVSRAIRHGQPANYLPPLSTRDIVYVAGPPALAQTVGRIAQASGTSCFADPFLPSSDEVDGKSFLSRTAEWFVPTAQPAPPLELFVGRH